MPFICCLSNRFYFFFSPHQVCQRIPILGLCFHFHHIYNLVRRIQKQSNHKTIKQQKQKHTHTQQQNSGHPRNSQSRHLKSASSTMKTIMVVHSLNPEKIISHPRRFPVSQIRRLKTDSLISRSLEGISQSRHLHHFPYSAPSISRIRHLSFPKHVASRFLFSSFCRLKNSAKTVRYISDGVVVVSNLVCSIFSEVIRYVPSITIVCAL